MIEPISEAQMLLLAMKADTEPAKQARDGECIVWSGAKGSA